MNNLQNYRLTELMEIIMRWYLTGTSAEDIDETICKAWLVFDKHVENEETRVGKRG